MEEIKSPPNRRVFNKDGFFLYFDPDNSRWLVLNKDGADILNILELFPDPQKALLELKKKRDVPEDTFHSFLNYIIENSHYLQKSSFIKRRIVHNSIQKLKTVYIHPSMNCNLNCNYCYNKELRRESLRSNKPVLQLSHYKNLFNDLKKVGVKSIVFTGGEPILSNDLFHIAELSLMAGFDNSIISNGILINDETAKKLVKYFTQISVSIDSHISQQNDFMRGAGSFKAALHGIKLLLENGASVNCLGVAHNENMLSLIDSWHYFVEKLKCNSFQAQAHLEDNLFAGDSNRLRSYLSNYSTIRRQLNQLNKSYTGLTLNTCCGMGKSEIAVTSCGDVYPCKMLLHNQFYCGNILDYSIEDILKHSLVLKNLKNLSVDDFQLCRNCDYKNLCFGSCRAIHFSLSGDLCKTNKNICNLSRELVVDAMWRLAAPLTESNENSKINDCF